MFFFRNLWPLPAELCLTGVSSSPPSVLSSSPLRPDSCISPALPLGPPGESFWDTGLHHIWSETAGQSALTVWFVCLQGDRVASEPTGGHHGTFPTLHHSTAGRPGRLQGGSSETRAGQSPPRGVPDGVGRVSHADPCWQEVRPGGERSPQMQFERLLFIILFTSRQKITDVNLFLVSRWSFRERKGPVSVRLWSFTLWLLLSFRGRPSVSGCATTTSPTTSRDRSDSETLKTSDKTSKPKWILVFITVNSKLGHFMVLISNLALFTH